MLILVLMILWLISTYYNRLIEQLNLYWYRYLHTYIFDLFLQLSSLFKELEIQDIITQSVSKRLFAVVHMLTEVLRQWLRHPVMNSCCPQVCCHSLICWPHRSFLGKEDFIWGSAPLLSGCHILRWHVATGPSGHACCQKQTDPLHTKGQGQCWDCPAQASPSKLSQTSQGASEGPDACGLSTVCERYQVGNAPAWIHSDPWGFDYSLL